MLLTREQLQDRLLALHKASLELVREVSLDTLLERIASIACEQAGARYAAMGVLDDEGKLKQFITVGMTAEEIKIISHSPRGLGLIGVLMHGDSGNIRIPEISDDPRAVGFPPGHPEMHSMLGVPIRVGGKQLGQIYLTEKIGVFEFSSDDEKIIEILATYAGAALENARLVEQLHERETVLTRRNEQLALLNQMGTALGSSLELEEILNKTLALIMDHFRVEVGEIFLKEENGETLRLVLHRGEAAETFWARNHFKIGEGMVGKVAQSLQPITNNHLEKDGQDLWRAVVEAGFKQMTCIPLTAHGEGVGVLAIATRSQKILSKRDLELLVLVSAGAGTAIENARLHSNIKRLTVLEERERIGMDLHDGIIQSIYGVGLSLENARMLMRKNPKVAEDRLIKAMDDLNHINRDIRNYILDLRPRNFQGESLIEDLERLISEFIQNTRLEASLAGPKEPLVDLPQINAMTLFHICKEALANIAKHAKASKVSVDLWIAEDRVLLEITDDGQGFDLERKSKGMGHGLTNIKTRAQTVGGDIDITSTPGKGTSILAWVPRVPPPTGA